MSEPSEKKITGVRNAGDLFTECRHRYGLTPDEVVGALQFANSEEMQAEVGEGLTLTSYGEALEVIGRRLTLHGGRVLRPESGRAGLKEAMEQAERRAWESLRQYRFQEFGHWAEMWASLSKMTGGSRKNPFGRVAALGRRPERRGTGG